MKKFLTVFLSCMLAGVMLVFTACGAPADTTYSGNYQEVDSEALYAATKDVSSDVNLTPTTETRAGISMSSSLKITTETGEYTSTESVAVNGKMVYSLDEGATTDKLEISLSVVTSNETVADSQTSSITTTYNYYSDGTDFYIHLIQNSNLNGAVKKNEYKIKTSKSKFDELLKPTLEDITKAPTATPEEQAEFIAFIDELISKTGYRFSIDSSDGVKVKIDLADNEKYAEYMKENDSDIALFDITINKFEMYYVFDKNNNLTARKSVSSIKQSSPYGIVKIESFDDTRAYNGAVSAPADLDSYIPTP